MNAEQHLTCTTAIMFMEILLCRRPAQGMARGMCKHEHLFERPNCGEHSARMYACSACSDFDGHICDMTIEFIPFSSTVEQESE